MLLALKALGKGQLQEAAVSPVLSGTPTLPSGVSTAETGAQSLTFPSPALFPGFATLRSLHLLGHITNLVLGRREESCQLRAHSHQGQSHP